MFIDRSLLKTNKELRAQAREQLKGNWGKAILACVVYVLILLVICIIPIVNFIAPILIAGPFALGLVCFFVKLSRKNGPQVSDIFSGFNSFGRAFVLQLLISIFTFLWMLLLYIPGIIAALRYSLAFYILNDNPEMRASEALNLSKEYMKGQKGKLFVLCLSFIGWYFLSCLTFGIGFLWLIPYMLTSMANFYEDVKNAHVNQPQVFQAVN